MTVDALATVADLTARGVTVNEGEEAIVGTFLTVASALVRDAAGSPISQVPSTVTLAGGSGQFLRLPSGPCTSISAVLLNGLEVTDHKLLNGSLWRACGWHGAGGPATVEVTYTAGYATVPADVVDLTCRLVMRALIAHRSAEGGAGLADRPVIQERIGDYSVRYADTDAASDMELPKYLRVRLAARFGGGPGTVVRFQ